MPKKFYSEVLISLARNATAARSSCQKAVLQQIRLINILQSHRLLVYGSRQRFQPDRAAVLKLDYAAQHPPVERVKAELIDLKL